MRFNECRLKVGEHNLLLENEPAPQSLSKQYAPHVCKAEDPGAGVWSF